MLYVKPVPDVDILFTIVTVYLSVFFSHSCCLPVSGEIKLYIKNIITRFRGDKNTPTLSFKMIFAVSDV